MIGLAGKVTYPPLDDVKVPKDGLCTRGVEMKPANVYFIVLIHVPSFSREQVLRKGKSGAVMSMDVDEERRPKREGRIFERSGSVGESEASTILLDRIGGGPVILCIVQEL